MKLIVRFVVCIWWRRYVKANGFPLALKVQWRATNIIWWTTKRHECCWRCLTLDKILPKLSTNVEISRTSFPKICVTLKSVQDGLHACFQISNKSRQLILHWKFSNFSRMLDMVYWLNSDQEQDMDTSLDNPIQKTEYGVERKR